MAIVAIPDDPYMLAGRGSGFYTTRVRMATGALPGCTGKNALSMAGLTVGDGVGKIQRETGCCHDQNPGPGQAPWHQPQIGSSAKI